MGIEVENEEQAKRLMREQECGICGGKLGYTFKEDRFYVHCSTDPSHVRLKRRREPVVGMELTVPQAPRLALLVGERFPDLDKPSANLFAYYCIRMSLDPLTSPAEVYPVVFKGKKGKIVVPIFSELGLGKLAAEACPQAWSGPPAAEPVFDADLKEAICNDRNAWVWKAYGRRKDWEEGKVYETYGWMTQRQWQKAKHQGVPAGEFPSNQARVRAIKRWYMEAFPEAAGKIRELRTELIQKAEGIKEVEEVIDAEYRVVVESLPSGKKKEKQERLL